MSNLRLFESFSSILVLSFLCFSCDALTPELAESAQKFIKKEGDCNGYETITNDGQYTESSSYKALQTIIERKNFKSLSDWSRDASNKYAQLNTIRDLKKIKALLESFPSKTNRNVTTIDVSYSNLKQYYDRKHKRAEIHFKEVDKDVDQKALNEIKLFFNDDAAEKSNQGLLELTKKHLFKELIFNNNDDKKYTDDGSKQKRLAALRDIFNETLKIIIGTDTGAKRLKSLLLAKLLAHIDGEHLLDFIPSNPSQSFTPEPAANDLIEVFDSNIAAGGGALLALNISDAGAIDVFTLSATNGNCTPEDIQNRMDKLQNVMRAKARGDGIRQEDKQDLLDAYKLLAITIVHELSHWYDGKLRLPFAFSSGAYLKNQRLAAKQIILLAPGLMEMVSQIATTDQNLNKYIRSEGNRSWCHTFEDALNRELAREICAINLNYMDMLAISGSYPIQVETDKFIEIVDSQSENSMRHELGMPYRLFGHDRFKFYSKPASDPDINTLKEKVATMCAPYKVNITQESDRNKIFEPYVLEEVINKAIKALNGTNIEMFYGQQFPTGSSSSSAPASARGGSSSVTPQIKFDTK